MKVVNSTQAGAESENIRYGAPPVAIDTAEIKHSQTDTTEKPVEISPQHVELYRSLYSDLAFFASGAELQNNPFEEIIKVMLQDNSDMTRDSLKDPQKAKDALKRYIESIGESGTKLKGDRLMLLQNIINWKAMTLQLATGITLDTKYLRPQSSIASPGSLVHIKNGEMIVETSTDRVTPYKGRNPISKLFNFLDSGEQAVRDSYETMGSTYIGGKKSRLRRLLHAMGTASRVSTGVDAIFHVNNPRRNMTLNLKENQSSENDESDDDNDTDNAIKDMTKAQIKLIQHTFGYTEGQGGNHIPIMTDDLLEPIVQYILLATESRRNLFVQTGGRNQDFDPNLIVMVDSKYKPRSAMERHYLQDTSYAPETSTSVDKQIVDQAKQISNRLIADIKKKTEGARKNDQKDKNRATTVATINALLSEIESVISNPPDTDKRQQDQERQNLQIQIRNLTKLRNWLRLGEEDGDATREAQLKKKDQLETEKGRLQAEITAYNTSHKSSDENFDVRNFAHSTHESSIAKDRIRLVKLEGDRDRIKSYVTSLENDHNNLTSRLTAIYTALGNLSRSNNQSTSVSIELLSTQLTELKTKNVTLEDEISKLRKKLDGDDTENGLNQDINKLLAQIRDKEAHVVALRSQLDRISAIDTEIAQITKTQTTFRTEYKEYFSANTDNDPEKWDTDRLYEDIADLERRLGEVGKDPDLERKSLVLTELNRFIEASGQEATRNRALRASRGELEFVADRRYTTKEGISYPWPYLRIAQIFMGDEVLLPGKANIDRLATFAKVFPPEQFFSNKEVLGALGLSDAPDIYHTKLRMMDEVDANRRDVFDKSVEKIVSSLLEEAGLFVRTSESFGRISIPDDQSNLWRNYDTIDVNDDVKTALSNMPNLTELTKLTIMFYYYESPRHLATLVHRYLSDKTDNPLRRLGNKDFSDETEANIISKQVAIAIDETRQRMMSIAN
jgi:hypothetical protein